MHIKVIGFLIQVYHSCNKGEESYEALKEGFGAAFCIY